MHLFAQRGVALIVVANQHQRGNVNRRQAVDILDRLEIAVDHELAVRAPHDAVEFPVGRSVASGRVVVRIRARAIEEGKVARTPGKRRVFGRVASVLPCLTFAEEAGCLEFIQAFQLIGRHGCLFAGQHFVHLERGGEGAVEDQVREVLLVLEGIGLCQHAAATVTEQRDLAQVQGHAHSLHILNHRLNRVEARVLKPLRAARAALVDEDEPVRASQWQKVRQKIVMGRAGTTVQNNQR